MIKKVLLGTSILVVLFFGALFWVKGLLPEKSHFQALKQTLAEDLPYLTGPAPENRGKILAVVTSVNRMGENKKTGYELTELARAYWVFKANGFEVDIASPMGGNAPVVIDGDDMGAYDYAFLNSKETQHQISNTIPLSVIDPLDYQAVYFVGGKGTMFDFPDNPHIQNIAKTLYQNDKVVSAVCHGPSALINVVLDSGKHLIDNKQVSGFTNEEELFLIPDAEQVFPFLLQDKLTDQGANFQAGTTYLEKVSQDGNLITGQNPWSVWAVAELVVEELGFTPKPRELTPEERAVDLLMTYHEEGFAAASEALHATQAPHQRVLIVMHGIVAFMQ